MSEGPQEHGRSPVTTRLRETAYHEAGHAVVGYCLHEELLEVSIVPNVRHRGYARMFRRGKTRWRAPRRGTWALGWWVERAVQVAFAGVVAQAQLTGTHDWGGARADMARVDRVSRLVCRDDEEALAFQAWLQVRTRKLVEVTWPAIERLAETLVERRTVGRQELLAIIPDALVEADVQGRLPWPWPREVRDALMRRSGWQPRLPLTGTGDGPLFDRLEVT